MTIYCGDRWANFAGNGLGYNQWYPLSFDGNTPYLIRLIHGVLMLSQVCGKWQTTMIM